MLSAEQAMPVHAALEWAAMLAGARLYFRERRFAALADALQPHNYAVLVGCLLGAALGNKAVFWLQNPQLWAPQAGWSQLLIGGQSMVGGLLGGLIGVESAKGVAGIRQSTGDNFVFPILLGLIIGRIGCFLAGLHDQTYGVPTTMPWGVDFGDGLRRHPTQLYEIAFAMMLWGMLVRARRRLRDCPGMLFKVMLTSYLLWRLLIDTLKPVPHAYALGLSGIQWVCLLALLCYLPVLLRQWRGAREAMA
jgi:phosphatidylglycerol---prolipoprotein diacylglyceryl transferase